VFVIIGVPYKRIVNLFLGKDCAMKKSVSCKRKFLISGFFSGFYCIIIAMKLLSDFVQ